MKRLRRIEIFCPALIAFVWILYVISGGPISRIAARHWGQRIVSATESYVSDPAWFIQLRLRDAAILFSIAAALVAGQSLIVRLILKRAKSHNTSWASHAVLGFVAVNLWLAAATHCTLFWLLLWQGREDTSALARFQLKHHLLADYIAPRKAVILGNSQARAQIDEALLNKRFAPRLFTSEIHFPGSKAFDIYLAEKHLEPDAAQVVICYVSELNFYGGAASVATPYFFGLSDCWDGESRDAFANVPCRELAYGLLGNILPCFYLRDAFAQRILGNGIAGIRQRQYDQALSIEISTNAANHTASGFVIDSLSTFQKHAFETFVATCKQRKEKLVIIAGQLNPRVGSQIDPAVRADLLAFLHELPQRFDNVVLVDDCPTQSEADYDDWTHVNKREQERFTEFIAKRLEIALVIAKTPAGRTNYSSIR